MRALTVHQPWAWLIVEGIKTNEYRKWQPGGRLEVGERFAIHAGANWTEEDLQRAQQAYPQARVPGSLDCGCIIGTVVFMGTEPTAKGYAWHLAKPLPAVTMDCKGQVGLWHVPEQLRPLAAHRDEK